MIKNLNWCGNIKILFNFLICFIKHRVSLKHSRIIKNFGQIVNYSQRTHDMWWWWYHHLKMFKLEFNCTFWISCMITIVTNFPSHNLIMEIVRKSFFHEFVFFAHKCHMFLSMYDASISKLKYVQVIYMWIIINIKWKHDSHHLYSFF
jgi:hypothetical protein